MFDLHQPAWQPDHLNRADEGAGVASYLINRSSERLGAGVPEAFVFSIQGDYGEGKSYFLQNLARQLVASHPVAFIDAWESDTIGDPYLALLNALDTALAPFLNKQGLKEKAGRLLGRSGAILGAAIKGSLKKGSEKYLGEEFAETIASALNAPEARTKSNDDDKAGEVGSAAIEAGMEEFDKAPSDTDRLRGIALGPTAMLGQLKLHKAARQAIITLRDALAAIVGAMQDGDGLKPPIFIFVDELDRCDPRYAVALLEEIKHLFDVAGIVFILGMQPDQLARSVAGVYGPSFDGAGYLDRLIHHKYLLKPASLSDFIEARLAAEPFPEGAFAADPFERTVVEAICAVFNYFGILPREAERALERMRVAVYACGQRGLLDPSYLALRCLVVRRVAPTAPLRRLSAEIIWPMDFGNQKAHRSASEGAVIEVLRSIPNQSKNWLEQSSSTQPERDLAAWIVRLFQQRLHDDSVSIVAFHDALLARVAPFMGERPMAAQ